MKPEAIRRQAIRLGSNTKHKKHQLGHKISCAGPTQGFLMLYYFRTPAFRSRLDHSLLAGMGVPCGLFCAIGSDHALPHEIRPSTSSAAYKCRAERGGREHREGQNVLRQECVWRHV